MSSATAPTPTSSYWCYRCNRFVRVFNNHSYSSLPPSAAVNCPDCNNGFVEEIDIETTNTVNYSLSDSRRHRFPAAAMYSAANSPPMNSIPISSSPRIRRIRRNAGDRSLFNPVIVLRAPPEEMNSDNGAVGGGGGGGENGYELYYDDGIGSGLRPLPASVSEFLLGSGFDRLLDQLAQIEINGVGRSVQPPASKAAIESMPTISILDSHVSTELHCAVCKELFELGVEAREMPCKHIYHPDCILPWLSLRNSCPLCRQEMDSVVGPQSEQVQSSGTGARRDAVEGGVDETVGLTIWRLPGEGGFAVGRFAGGRRVGGERELPVVYTEMDGEFNQGGGVPRRISWGSLNGRDRESGRGRGIRRFMGNLFSCFGGICIGAEANSSDSSSSSSDLRIDGSRRRALSFFGSGSRRRNRGLDVGGWVRRW